MIIKDFENQGLLFNVAFVEPGGEAGTLGFRGRLALVEGEVGDASGNRKPPTVVMEQTVLLSKDDKLALLAGSLDRLQDLPTLATKYRSSLAPSTLAIVYVVNATEPMQVELEGANFALVPMREGVVWNELMDAAGLDKGDVKKLSSGAKVLTVFKELAGYRPKGAKVSLEEALTRTADIRRVERGAL